MNSTITVEQIIDELRTTYLDDESGKIWSETAITRQVQRALQMLILKVSDTSPEILIRSVTIPYVFGTTEYDLLSPIPPALTALAPDFMRPYSVKIRDVSSTPASDYELKAIHYGEVVNGVEEFYIRDSYIGINLYAPLTGSIILDYIRGLNPTVAFAGASTVPFSDDWASLIALGAAIRLKSTRVANDAMASSLNAMRDMYDGDLLALQEVYAKRSKDRSNRISAISGGGYQ